MLSNNIPYFGGNKGSAAVDAPSDAIRATDEPNHPNIDDGHSAVSSGSSVLMPMAFQAANPNPVRKLPLEDRSKGRTAQESDAQSTSVDAASTTTKDEVKNDTSIDDVNVENKKEKKELYIRVKTTWEWDLLDGALEYAVLDVESECIPKKGPAAKFMAMAKAEGFNVRNFPAKHRELTTQEYEHALDVHNSSIIDVFPAHKKALHYHYTRRLFLKGIFDFPINSLTAEDVDRLRTIGFIRNEHVEFVIGYAMLGHGALRRTLRHSQKPGPNGKKLLARRRWTVKRGCVPPTKSEINNYIYNAELARLRAIECGKETPFLLLADRRPKISNAWLSHHVEKYGIWGKKCLGYDDAEVVKAVKEPDESFISPEFVAYEPFVAEADILPAPSQQHLVTPPPSPIRCRSADTGAKGNGKKRERSPSAIPKVGPSGSRRTRSRITVIDNELSSESESEAMSSPSAQRSRRRLSKPKPKRKPKSRPVANPSFDNEYSSDPDPALLSPLAVGAPRPSKPRRKPVLKPASVDEYSNDAVPALLSPWAPRPSKPKRKPVLKPASEDEYSSDPDPALLSPCAAGSRRRLSKLRPTPISMPSATERVPRISDKFKGQKRARDENEQEGALSEDGSSPAKKVKGESVQNVPISLPSDQPNFRRPLQRERRTRLDRYGVFQELDEKEPFRAHSACFPGANPDNVDVGPVVCPPLVRPPSMDINVETIDMREGMNPQVGSSSVCSNHPVQRQPRKNDDPNALDSDVVWPQYPNALRLYNMVPAI